jgi:hypothetical protein
VIPATLCRGNAGNSASPVRGHSLSPRLLLPFPPSREWPFQATTVGLGGGSWGAKPSVQHSASVLAIRLTPSPSSEACAYTAPFLQTGTLPMFVWGECKTWRCRAFSRGNLPREKRQRERERKRERDRAGSLWKGRLQAALHRRPRRRLVNAGILRFWPIGPEREHSIEPSGRRCGRTQTPQTGSDARPRDSHRRETAIAAGVSERCMIKVGPASADVSISRQHPLVWT